MKTHIITHRGLDPDRSPYYKESSLQAFEDQLARGYGLEFDIQFSRDEIMIAIHDSDLKRLTNSKDTRSIIEIDSTELLSMQFEDNTLTTIPHLLYLIKTQSASDSLSALHLKHMHQTPNCMNILLETLQTIDPKKLIIFDVKVDAAKYLYSHNKQLQIAASVAHPYDIKRYNNAVGGTLMTIEDLIANKNIFTWAWLDEWDLTDKDNGIKSLYNKETFNRLRDQQIKIALVTPELHATSPGLVGNEAHQDAQNQERLSARFTRIINLQPDAICTDHPDYIYSLINRRTNCK